MVELELKAALKPLLSNHPGKNGKYTAHTPVPQPYAMADVAIGHGLNPLVQVGPTLFNSTFLKTALTHWRWLDYDLQGLSGASLLLTSCMFLLQAE